MGGRGEQQRKAGPPGITSCFHHQPGQVTHLSEPQLAHLYAGNESMVVLSITAQAVRATVYTIVTTINTF